MGDKKYKHDDSLSEDDNGSRRKHKKSKSFKKSKDKYRDRSRSHERDKHKGKYREHSQGCERDKHKCKDRERSKDKFKDKDKNTDLNVQKSVDKDDTGLSAAEKFNIFKKQREAAKMEDSDKIVDDLFKDFIASKIRQIENDDTKSEESKAKSRDKVVSSVVELNKFLDSEINSLNSPYSVTTPTTVISENTSAASSEKALSEVENCVHAIKSEDSNKTVKQEVVNPYDKCAATKSEKEIIIKGQDQEMIIKEETEQESQKLAGQFLPLLPRSLTITEKKENTEDTSQVVKKPPLGFKHFGIKLSSTSKELIESGQLHKKGKRLEEGEVLSSSDTESEVSDTSIENHDDDDDDEKDGLDRVSDIGSVSNSDGEKKTDSKSRKKKKKKKKGKHKKKKNREKDKEEDETRGKLRKGSKRKETGSAQSRSRSPKKSKRSRSKERSRKRSRSHSRTRSKRSSSRGRCSKSKEASLRSSRRRSRSRSRRSTSKSRQKSRSRSKDHRSRSRSKGHRSRSRSKGRRSRSRGRRSHSRGRKSKSRSRSPDRFWRSKYGDFDAYKFLKRRRSRSQSRSKTPERERDRFIDKEKKRLEDLRCKIDKAKLREIAIKNALSMAKTGIGPQLDVTLKAGGKSVEELTEYCKRIQEKEDLRRGLKNQYDSSSDEDVNRDEEEEELHHPFKVKEAAPIIMDIKNFKQLPLVTPQERLAQASTLRLQFPVSSGSQHREKEWVPVEPTPPQPPAGKIKPGPVTSSVGGKLAITGADPVQPTPDIKVFEEPAAVGQALDITAIVSERLTAVRKLAENPHDQTAKIILDQAQEKAKLWAQSKDLPGQFVGSTGANVMSQEELMGDKRRQAWLRKVPIPGGCCGHGPVEMVLRLSLLSKAEFYTYG